MSTPLCTVVIPAYNAERWLREALDSVLAQTWPSIEVLVVNDGSTDGTSALARSLNDPRIKVIDKPNGGVSTARNTGIEAARGTYISFMDADDAMAPDNLERKITTLEQQGVDWVYSDMWPCDAQMRPAAQPERAADGDLIRIILTAGGIAVPGISSNILVHRRCFASGLRFDPELSNEADQDIVLGLASSYRHARVPAPLAMYRVLPGSMSRNIDLYQKDHLRLFAKARRLGLLDDRAFRKRCMASAYWAIGGSWWVNARRPIKAIPWLLRAVWTRPWILVQRITRK